MGILKPLIGTLLAFVILFACAIYLVRSDNDYAKYLFAEAIGADATICSQNYSEQKFKKVQLGETSEQVIAKLGQPVETVVSFDCECARRIRVGKVPEDHCSVGVDREACFASKPVRFQMKYCTQENPRLNYWLREVVIDKDGEVVNTHGFYEFD